ncbi:MAG TPA: rhomboid family intramembrane serine protease [Bryobacteraceae bacterium]|nr:rhomboid family intramembrane serine protease [Bryobacteraceae bacterium]
MDQRRMCPNCRAFITIHDKVCPYCQERVGPRAVERRDPGAILGGFIPHARFVTMIILTINVGLFLATVVFSQRSGEGGGFFSVDGQTLLDFGAKYRAAIINYGQWWRLVTAGFLHGGLLHIGMNSWVLFDLGAQVEDVFGASRLIVIYFLSTVFGFLLSTFWTSALSVGASAGIMGLIGAMIALGVHNRHSAAGSALRGMYVRWAIYVFIFGLLPGLHIDNAAHFGGLAAGFGTAWLAGTPRIDTAWSERLWRGAAAACVVITAACFLMMYLWFASATQ